MTNKSKDRLHCEIRRSFLVIGYELAALRFQLALKRFADLCRRGGFNPGQPRLPAGQTGGGQWTDGDVVLVAGRGRGPFRIPLGGRLVEVTPGQAARYSDATLRREDAFRRARERDPKWEPQPRLSDPNSIEGQIRRAEFEAREAEAFLRSPNPGFSRTEPPPLPRSSFPRGIGDNLGPPLNDGQATAWYRSTIGMP